MLKPLDYILDFENIFWIISYYQGNKIYGKKVYIPDENGERYHPELNMNYRKEVSDYSEIPKYKKEYKPNDCYIEKKDLLTGVWKKFIEGLNIIGINDKDIGIFGSILIGFDIKKDVDFVIYGKNNLNKYYENSNFIKAYTNTNSISKEHIEYQLKKYGKKYNDENDLEKILNRNWSGIELDNGILSTPRFLIDGTYKIPERTGEDRLIECKVISGITSSCMPRFIDVLYQNEIYKLITPFWMFQSFACDNDKLIVYGNVNDSDKTILLSKKQDYIKIK